jgi:transketolase
MNNLPEIAKEVRKLIIKMIFESGVGHPGGSLSAADILVSLYFSILNQKPEDPQWEDRDRFILSPGHLCPALYAVMAKAGYFSEDILSSQGSLDSKLQGHPERERLPGIETTSGSLGMGLGQAAGMAYAAKMDEKKFHIYCLASDGEHNEGSHWEAVMFTAKNSLTNLTLIVDRNRIQIDGTTEEVSPLENLVDKYKAFNWNVLEIDGHNFDEIEKACLEAKEENGKPTVIIANTTLGKGISFMNTPEWHGKVPSKEEYEQAMEELNA